MPEGPIASIHSTLPQNIPGMSEERRGRALRRGGLAVFTAFVLLGLCGQLGVRSSTVRQRSGALSASLTFARVARPSLAVPYRLVISRAGGFDAPVEVRISSRYLEALDMNGINPEPAEQSSDESDLILTFDPPDSDELTVWFDSRIEPGAQWRVRATTTVNNGEERLRFDATTWILP